MQKIVFSLVLYFETGTSLSSLLLDSLNKFIEASGTYVFLRIPFPDFQSHGGLIKGSGMLTISHSSCLNSKMPGLIAKLNILWDFWVAHITPGYIMARSRNVNIALKEKASKCDCWSI